MTKIKFYTDPFTGRLFEDSAKRYFSRFGIFAVVFYVALSVFQIIVSFTVQASAPWLLENSIFFELLSLVSLYAVAFPLSLLVLAPLPTVIPTKEKMPVRDILCAFCICEGLMLVGNYISSILMSAVTVASGGYTPTNPLADSVESRPMWITLIFTVLLAPILEELFFRGAVCKKLLSLGEGYAIVLSSAFFALCHGNFFQLFYAFITGCFFGFIYVKTGRLIYTTVMHIFVNLLGTVVVTWMMDISNIEELLAEPLTVSPENALGLLIFGIYELIILGISVFGIATLIKHRKRIQLDSGLLSPPEGRAGVSCVLMNGGIAAAIAVFALSLVGSLMI